MYIVLDPKSSRPIYEQIIHKVKEQVALGVALPGDKVPSVREMSSQLMVNPNTVSRAYRELEGMGIFVTMRGKGTFISDSFRAANQEEAKRRVQEKVKETVLDAIYGNVAKQTYKQWLDRYYKELGGGESHED
ncbi:GntR family transcriptional regulator [Alteribacillus sp. HJP-4]|uniref:GntR family transcriptional regulator n=1 Tax=Alteribacillus sp. HJP-4 TaxID=2775394 RepID=UPI0035CD2AF4